MPLHLDIKRKLSSRSDRVKSLDIHPNEPWMLCSLYNGNVHVWNVEQHQLVKNIEVCNVPVRSAKFVARKFWILTGSDDMMLRVYNYNTMERVHELEVHSDYIRCIAVHPIHPYVLTCSDDMQIKLWDWDANWKCKQTFEGHSNYVMQIAINPKDNNTFASASLDRTIKVWNIGSSKANYTLEGHEFGINCVDYYSHGDKPYLASGSDDKTVKIWDYQTKSCVQTLEGHTQNVTFVAFHGSLPVVLSGSEDGTVRIWHTGTYRLESTLNYGLERAWCISVGHGPQSRYVALGYDEGSAVISLGSDAPVMSMDASGKLICSRHCDVFQANLRSVLSSLDESQIKDGEQLPVAFKELGTSELYPKLIMHNANGRFVVVCGDGEYEVLTALTLRNKTFGQAQEFVWSPSDAAMYAIRENSSSIKIFKNFKEANAFKLDHGSEQLFTGPLLGVRFSAGGGSCLAFHDWDSGQLVRRIEIHAKNVWWNESGRLVAICAKDEFFVLSYNAEVVAESMANGSIGNDPDGEEGAFEVVENGQVSDSIVNGFWYGDAFLFTNKSNRLRYYVGGEIITVAHLDRPMHLLGYLPKDNLVFLGDRNLQIVSYTLPLSVLEYETAVMRGDHALAEQLLPKVPDNQRTKIAQFLEKQNLFHEALQVTTDSDHKFDLAMRLNDHRLAYRLLNSEATQEGLESKWKLLAEAASKDCEFDLAQECLVRSKDYASLLLMATSSGNLDMMHQLALQSKTEKKHNLAFLACFLMGDLEGCLDVLLAADRLPEAAFFARTYLPSRVPSVVVQWQAWLKATSRTAGDQKYVEAIADPSAYANLFPGYGDALKAEQMLKQERSSRLRMQANTYSNFEHSWERDVVAECEHFEPGAETMATVEPQLVPPTEQLLQPLQKLNIMANDPPLSPTNTLLMPTLSAEGPRSGSISPRVPSVKQSSNEGLPSSTSNSLTHVDLGSKQSLESVGQQSISSGASGPGGEAFTLPEPMMPSAPSTFNPLKESTESVELLLNEEEEQLDLKAGLSKQTVPPKKAAAGKSIPDDEDSASEDDDDDWGSDSGGLL